MNNIYIDKQKGIILPVVLIFFSFLMLLGVTFVTVSGFQVSQSMNQVDRSQAYYLAKSGAETISEYINIKAEEETDLDTFFKTIETTNFKDVEFKNVSNTFSDIRLVLNIKVEVYEKDQKDYIKINALAEVRESNAKVELLLEVISQKTGVLGDGVAVIVVENELTANNIDIKNEFIDKQDKEDYPSPFFPSGIIIDIADYSDQTFSVFNEIRTIGENVYYNKIEIDSQNDNKKGVLNINADGSTYKNTRIIRVNELVINGEINITSENDSKVIIYVEDSLVFGQNKRVEVNVDGNPDDLMILYAGNDEITVKNIMDYNGLLYAPNSSLNLKNKADIKGSVVVNSLSAVGSNASIDGQNVSFEIFSEFLNGQNMGNGGGFKIMYADNPWNMGDADE